MSEQVEQLTGEEIDAAWLEILTEAAEEAAEGFERWQFGKLSVAPRYLKWVEVDGKRKPQEISGAVYAQTPKRQRSLELVFGVDIQEFNSALEWEYERRVGLGSVDWNQILVPSIEAVCGEGSMSGEQMSTTLGQLRDKYVRAKDVLQSPTKKNPDPQYRTIALDTVYDDRDACYSAWYAIYGGSVESDDLAPATGWEDEWSGFDFAEVVDEIAEQVVEYGGLGEVAEQYYDVSLASLAKALVAGGMNAAAIAKLDDDHTPKSIKQALE